VIDLGPGGGDAAVFEGTPGELVHAPESSTGEHLARHVGAVAAG
jgi:excinuclease UvrABC ATPase subunit